MPERMPNILPGRLLEAREYLGFTREEVASATDGQAGLIAELEAGGTTITGEQLRKLSRLYRRPIAWFSDEYPYQPSEGLLRKVEHLTPGDREAVLDFAEFLAGAGPAATLRGEASDG
jgi:transcriptional regulator with XRE-family HTH domain